MGDTPKQPALRATGDEESILQEISILLRDGRLDAGESIEEVAAALRINRRYLEAIEEGRFGDLPGPVYTLGFIRSFGDYVGLDGEELVRSYKSVSSETGKRAELDFPEPIPESGLPGGAVLFAGLVVAGLAYGGWYVLSEDDSLLSDIVAPVPEQLAQKTEQSEGTAVEDPLVVIEQEPAVVVGEPDTASADGETTQRAEETAPATETAGDEAAVDGTAVATEDAAEAVSETAGDDVTASGAAEAVTAAVEEAAVLDEEPAVAQPEPEPEPEPESESVAEEAVAEPRDEEPSADAGDTASSLNQDQLRAIQAEMIDAPMPEPPDESDAGTETVPEEADEAAESPVSGSEPVPAETPEPSEEPSLAATDAEPVEPAAETVAEETATATAAEDTPGTGAAPAETVDSDTDIAAAPAEEPAEVEEPAATEEPEGAATPGEETVRVIIRARENSWVEVSDSTTGDILYSRLMRAGDRYLVPDREGLVLQTGNAGALEVIVDGDLAPAIGTGGQVARNVSLDADALRAGTATP